MCRWFKWHKKETITRRLFQTRNIKDHSSSGETLLNMYPTKTEKAFAKDLE